MIFSSVLYCYYVLLGTLPPAVIFSEGSAAATVLFFLPLLFELI